MTHDALTGDETAVLARVAAAMIPASAAHGVPGADDPAIMADILTSAARDPAPIRAALAEFAAAPDIASFPVDHPAAAARLQTLIALCYYRDARVLRSLGKERRAPYPGGYALAPDDWSILDPVRARPPLWRPANDAK